MDHNKIVAELARIFEDKIALNASSTPLSAKLREDLGLDSMALLTMVVEIENHFRICLDPSAEQDVETLQDLVELIDHSLTIDARERCGSTP